MNKLARDKVIRIRLNKSEHAQLMVACGGNGGISAFVRSAIKYCLDQPWLEDKPPAFTNKLIFQQPPKEEVKRVAET